jgi:uncharacterized protein YigA (DUF484 family)
LTAALPAPSPTDEAERAEKHLRANPAFLAERPELYASLEPPRRVHGEVLADHMAAMLDAARRHGQVHQAETEALVAAARVNMAAQARIQRAVVALLRTRDRLGAIDAIAQHLPELLGVDAVTLCAERPAPPAFRTLPPGTVASLIPPGREATLRAEAFDQPLLYGEAAPLVASDALLRLDPEAAGGRPALVAIGVRDGGTYDPSQGTELLTFLAAAIAAALSRD